MIRPKSKADQLAADFLSEARVFQANVEPVRVLKSRTYKIGEAHVLVRASTETTRRYFFGINYLTVEEIANLDNPFIAFICGSSDQTIIIPAKLLFSLLPQISHDRNGEYKINIDQQLNLVLSGRGNRLDCREFLNGWDSLLNGSFQSTQPRNSAEESLHAVLQGRLLEMGSTRGFETFCPDKSRTFNERTLSELSTLAACPTLQFSDHDLLRQIDVIWFKSKGSNLIPEKAFEVELSTGVWSGVGRMATLIDYTNVDLFVIANDSKKFRQVMTSFRDFANRYRFIDNESVGQLYSAEMNLRDLRSDLGL